MRSKKKKVDAAKKIQANYKGTKTRQLLNNNIDFQDKINAKIKNILMMLQNITQEENMIHLLTKIYETC